MKVAFGVEYDGSRFAGWQRQAEVRTVQASIESALSKVANTPVLTFCAGRTDAGVHASGQVIHIETVVDRAMRSWVLGANANLASDVSIVWAKHVDDDFHARFSATHRTYRYIICNRAARSGLWNNRVAFCYKPLDADRMHAAAQCLIGEHDFASFRAAGCQSRHAIREITRLDISRSGDLIEIIVTANAFVQHMVRNIVGTLLAVGDGRQTPQWVGYVLGARDRTVAGETAPPQGLYLVRVGYPEKFHLPDADETTGLVSLAIV